MKDSNSFVMKRCGIYVTRVCSLNCKLCSAYSPYRKNDYFPSVSELCEYIHRYMGIVDYCEHFMITGGEPLLHKDLPKIIDYLFDNFSAKIGRLEIITNGTVVPSRELLESIKKNEGKFFRFLIDDYGKELSKKINEVVLALDKYSLPYEIRDNYSEDVYCGGWFDLGSLTEQIHTQEEASCLYKKCIPKTKMNFCFPIVDGKMIPCGPVGRRIMLGTAFPNEYIDLMDSTLTVEQQRQKIKNIYSYSCLETCKFCKGMCDDSPRFMPAEQLTSDEILKIRGKTRI